jgi:hypothetical protein
MKPNSSINRKQGRQSQEQEEGELEHGEGEKEACSGADRHDVGRLQYEKETVNPNERRSQSPKSLDKSAEDGIQPAEDHWGEQGRP